MSNAEQFNNKERRGKGTSFDEVMKREALLNGSMFEKAAIRGQERMQQLMLEAKGKLAQLKQEVQPMLQTTTQRAKELMTTKVELPRLEAPKQLLNLSTKAGLAVGFLALSATPVFATPEQPVAPDGQREPTTQVDEPRYSKYTERLLQDQEAIKAKFAAERATLSATPVPQPAPITESRAPQPVTVEAVAEPVIDSPVVRVEPAAVIKKDSTTQAAVRQTAPSPAAEVTSNSQTKTPEVKVSTTPAPTGLGTLNKEGVEQLSAQFREQFVNPGAKLEVTRTVKVTEQVKPSAAEQSNLGQNSELGQRIVRSKDGKLTLEIGVPIKGGISEQSVGEKVDVTNFKAMGSTLEGNYEIGVDQTNGHIVFRSIKDGSFYAPTVTEVKAAPDNQEKQITVTGEDSRVLEGGLGDVERFLQRKMHGTDHTFGQLIMGQTNTPTTASANPDIKNNPATTIAIAKLIYNFDNPRSQTVDIWRTLKTVHANSARILSLPSNHPMRALLKVKMDMETLGVDFNGELDGKTAQKLQVGLLENTTIREDIENKKGLVENLDSAFRGALNAGQRQFPNEGRIREILSWQNRPNFDKLVQGISKDELASLLKSVGGNAGVTDGQIFRSNQQSDVLYDFDGDIEQASNYLEQMKIRLEAQRGWKIVLEQDSQGRNIGVKQVFDQNGQPVDAGVLTNEAKSSLRLGLNIPQMLITAALGNPSISGFLEARQTTDNSSVVPGMTQQDVQTLVGIAKKYGNTQIDRTGMPPVLFNAIKTLSDYRSAIPGLNSTPIPILAFKGSTESTSWQSQWIPVNPDGSQFSESDTGRLRGLVTLINALESDPQLARGAELAGNPQFIQEYAEHLAKGNSRYTGKFFIDGRQVTPQDLEAYLQVTELAAKLRIPLVEGSSRSTVAGVTNIDFDRTVPVEMVGLELSNGEEIDRTIVHRLTGYDKLPQDQKLKVDQLIKEVNQQLRKYRSELPTGMSAISLRNRSLLGQGLRSVDQIGAADAAFARLREQGKKGRLGASEKVGPLTLRVITAKEAGLSNLFTSQVFNDGLKPALLQDNVQVIEVASTNGSTEYYLAHCYGNPIRKIELIASADFVNQISTTKEAEGPRRNSLPNLATELQLANIARIRGNGNTDVADIRLRIAEVQEQALEQAFTNQLSIINRALDSNRSVDGLLDLARISRVQITPQLAEYYQTLVQGKQDAAEGKKTEAAAVYQAHNQTKAGDYSLFLSDTSDKTRRVDVSVGGLFSGGNSATRTESIAPTDWKLVGQATGANGETVFTYSREVGGKRQIIERNRPLDISVGFSGSERSDTQYGTLSATGINSPELTSKAVRANVYTVGREQQFTGSIAGSVDRNTSQVRETRNTETRQEIIAPEVSDFQLRGNQPFIPQPPSTAVPIPGALPTPGFQRTPDGKLVPVSPTPPGQTVPFNPGQPDGVGANPGAIPTAPTPPSNPIPFGGPATPPTASTTPGSIPTAPTPPSTPIPFNGAPTNPGFPTGPQIPTTPQVPTAPTPTIPTNPTGGFSSFGLGGKAPGTIPNAQGGGLTGF